MTRLVLTCEHGGNAIPAAYRPLFRGQADLLRTHRGWDIGALAAARLLAHRLGVRLHAATVSRLVIDLNRSLHHRNLFSDFTRTLPPAERERIIAQYYHPHRAAARADIAAGRGRVLHLAVHSFTPVLHGVTRACDIGLLFDPTRHFETALARRLQAELAARLPALRVRRNYPYRGISDGFGTALRRQFAPTRYAAMEIEINQKHVHPGATWRALQSGIADSLAALLQT